MRAKGIARCILSKDGSVEAWLGPPPAPTLGKKPPGKDAPLAERREHYEILLGRPVTDAELAHYP